MVDSVLLDILLSTGCGLLGGLGSGYLRTFFAPPSPSKLPYTISSPIPVTGPGIDKVYVRFHFLDGSVEVKKFFSKDMELELLWRGRKFGAGQWTEDGHIYNEVTQ